MAAVDTGKSFANGEQLTAAKLNQMFGNSTFGSGAVDNSTISIDTSGKLAVNQITSSNIANNAIGLSDLAQVSTDRVLGRLSDESGNVEQITVDEDLTSVSANHDELATSKAIKDYVDTTAAPTVGFSPTTYTGGESVTFPNGLIMKWGEETIAGDNTGTATFGTAFPNECIQAQATLGQSFNTSSDAGCGVYSLSTTSLTLINGVGTSKLIRWFAIGR